LLDLGLLGQARASRGMRRDPIHSQRIYREAFENAKEPVRGGTAVIRSNSSWLSRRPS
jgi:hypothetical protein